MLVANNQADDQVRAVAGLGATVARRVAGRGGGLGPGTLDDADFLRT